MPRARVSHMRSIFESWANHTDTLVLNWIVESRTTSEAFQCEHFEVNTLDGSRHVF